MPLIYSARYRPGRRVASEDLSRSSGRGVMDIEGVSRNLDKVDPHRLISYDLCQDVSVGTHEASSSAQ